MKKYIIIHFVVLTFSLIYTVSSGDITAAKKNVEEALINDTVVMKWQVTPGQNQKILSLLLYVLPDDIQVIQGILLPVVTPQGKPLFQDRLTATFNTAGKNEYIATLERIQYKDNHTYQLRVVFDDAINFERKNATIQIKSVVDETTTTPHPTGTGAPTPTDKGKIKGGIIAIIVIASIIFVALIVVGIVLFLRWKKNHPSKTDTSEQMKSLKTTKSTEEGVHYASTDVTVPPEKRDQQVYAQVDRSGGGGRDGPKPEVVKSDYAQMQVDADGYPASGPTSSTPPDENEDGISSGVVV